MIFPQSILFKKYTTLAHIQTFECQYFSNLIEFEGNRRTFECQYFSDLIEFEGNRYYCVALFGSKCINLDQNLKSQDLLIYVAFNVTGGSEWNLVCLCDISVYWTSHLLHIVQLWLWKRWYRFLLLMGNLWINVLFSHNFMQKVNNRNLLLSVWEPVPSKPI